MYAMCSMFLIRLVRCVWLSARVPLAGSVRFAVQGNLKNVIENCVTNPGSQEFELVRKQPICSQEHNIVCLVSSSGSGPSGQEKG